MTIDLILDVDAVQIDQAVCIAARSPTVLVVAQGKAVHLLENEALGAAEANVGGREDEDVAIER